LIFLVAALSPGLVYHRALARFVQRDKRSTVIEVVELATVGALVSLVAVIVVAGLAELVPAFVTLSELTGDLSAVRRQPWHVVASCGMTLVLSYALALAGGIAAARTSADLSSRIKDGSAWSGVLAKRRDGRPAFLAIEVDDGRLIEGFLRGVSVAEDPARDMIALKKPIAISGPGKATRKAVEDDFVVIPRSIIRVIRGKYVPPKTQAAPPSGK
jgi:hypothetical protein